MISCNRPLIRCAWLFVLLLVCGNLLADPLLEKQRALYSEVEQALKRGSRTLFLRHLDVLHDYPLYPYLRYSDMAHRIAHIKPETIIDFLNRYDATPVADKLRQRWLKHLMVVNNHQLFAQHYQSSAYYTDKVLACFYAQSLLQSRRFDELQELVRRLWLVDFSQPSECDTVFLWGKETRVIDQYLIWQRIVLVIKSGRIKLADYLARQLDTDTRTWYDLLKQGYYHPFTTLKKIGSYSPQSPFLHHVLLQSMARAQYRDLNRAHAVWQDIKSRFRTYLPLYEQVAKKLGITACRQLEPDIALTHLSPLSNVDNDKELYYWRIRCALRRGEWDIVLETIEDLDYQERTSSRWLYWKARALASTGNNAQAIAIWSSIASEASYYGYAAADRIGSAYKLSTELPTLEIQILNKMKNTDPMKRIYEFFNMGRIYDARRELLYMLPKLNRDERIGVALLCRQWQQATCAIEALGDAIFWHQELELRFPMPYRESVHREAARVDVAEYWVYAVMRRESAFMKDIKSPAGALGLMQLMPATAARTAKRLGVNYSSVRALLQPDFNIRLGAYYLKYVYRLNNNNWATALASYNAGYHRVQRWKSRAAVRDTDIWIETIPITETRRYLRAVLFYATVYHYKLHRKMIRLSTLVATM